MFPPAATKAGMKPPMKKKPMMGGAPSGMAMDGPMPPMKAPMKAPMMAPGSMGMDGGAEPATPVSAMPAKKKTPMKSKGKMRLMGAGMAKPPMMGC